MVIFVEKRKLLRAIQVKNTPEFLKNLKDSFPRIQVQYFDPFKRFNINTLDGAGPSILEISDWIVQTEPDKYQYLTDKEFNNFYFVMSEPTNDTN